MSDKNKGTKRSKVQHRTITADEFRAEMEAERARKLQQEQAEAAPGFQQGAILSPAPAQPDVIDVEAIGDEEFGQVFIPAMTEVRSMKEGDVIAGFYIGSRMTTTRYGHDCAIHYLWTDQQGARGIFGSMALDQGFRGCRRGVLTRVKMTGKRQLENGHTLNTVQVMQHRAGLSSPNTPELRQIRADFYDEPEADSGTTYLPAPTAPNASAEIGLDVIDAVTGEITRR